MEKFNFERNLKNWLICVTVFIAVTMVINGLIALIGWEGDETRFTEGPNRLPPGWIIGLVWTILFIGMASAFWLLASSTEITSRRKAGEVLAFAIFCLSYPIFTMGFWKSTKNRPGNWPANSKNRSQNRGRNWPGTGGGFCSQFSKPVL